MILFLDGTHTSWSDNAVCIKSIKEFTKDEKFVSVKIEKDMNWNRVCRYLEDAHAIVLGADVYMDSVSPEVLEFLERVEQEVIDGESIGGKFYAVLYTDLYEGEQTGIAMAVLKNFCGRANITWGRGLGIGGNNLNAGMRKKRLRTWIHKNTIDFRQNFFHEQALFIREKIQGTDVYVNPKEVSRGGYIRRLNHESKKNNRVNTAEN